MVGRAGLEPACFYVMGLQPTAIAAMPPADMWSEWCESNTRFSVPKTDGFPLVYTPIFWLIAEPSAHVQQSSPLHTYACYY